LIFSLYIRCSTLLYMPPLRFHCVGASEDAGIEPRTVATTALAVVRRTKTTRLDLIHSTRSHPQVNMYVSYSWSASIGPRKLISMYTGVSTSEVRRTAPYMAFCPARGDWLDRFDLYCDGRSAPAIPATGIYLIRMAKGENDLVVFED
jgi:hypothetical protein